MTENDIPRYDLELVRSSSTMDVANDTAQLQEPQVIYKSSECSMLNPTIIVIFAILLGVIAGLTIANTVNRHG
jgi:hypothetical protein